jgi:hypothetical protein
VLPRSAPLGSHHGFRPSAHTTAAHTTVRLRCAPMACRGPCMHPARCTLHAARCTLHAARCTLHAAARRPAAPLSPRLLVGRTSPHSRPARPGHSRLTGGGDGWAGGRAGGVRQRVPRHSRPCHHCLPVTDTRSACGACADAPALARSEPRQEQAHQLQHGGVL